MLKCQTLLQICLLGISVFLNSNCSSEKETILFINYNYTSTPGISCSSIDEAEGLFEIIIDKNSNSELYNQSGLKSFQSLEDTIEFYGADIKEKIQLKNDTFCLNLSYLKDNFAFDDSQMNIINSLQVYLEKNKNEAQEINSLFIPEKD